MISASTEPYLARWDMNAEQRCWPLQAALVTVGRAACADVVIEGDLLVRHYATAPTNQQIADELCPSLEAVKTHLRILFHKFGVEHLPQNQKRARLAEMALEFGLVPSHQP